jgi:hypothetical protein
MSGTVSNLERAIKTFKSRDVEYGNAFMNHGDIIKAFFPQGIFLHDEQDMKRFAAFQAIIGKLNRYAVNFSNGGHKDSIHDAICFCAMLEEIDEAC